MTAYKTENHVVKFIAGCKRWTRRPVLTTDLARARKELKGNEAKLWSEWPAEGAPKGYGKFWAIVSCRRGTARYYTGQTGARGRGGMVEPLFTKRAEKAEYYIDKEAAEEALFQMRDKRLKAWVEAVYLDYENTLLEQRFIIALENADKQIFYLESTDNCGKTVKTCRSSAKARKMAFRECLNVVGLLRCGNRSYKYSMLHDFGRNVSASRLIDYLRRTKPSDRISLTFKIPDDGR